jgi:hypothetical protein
MAMELNRLAQPVTNLNPRFAYYQNIATNQILNSDVYATLANLYHCVITTLVASRFTDSPLLPAKENIKQDALTYFPSTMNILKEIISPIIYGDNLMRPCDLPDGALESISNSILSVLNNVSNAIVGIAIYYNPAPMQCGCYLDYNVWKGLIVNISDTLSDLMNRVYFIYAPASYHGVGIPSSNHEDNFDEIYVRKNLIRGYEDADEDEVIGFNKKTGEVISTHGVLE